jgi:hypothetical protein
MIHGALIESLAVMPGNKGRRGNGAFMPGKQARSGYGCGVVIET